MLSRRGLMVTLLRFLILACLLAIVQLSVAHTQSQAMNADRDVALQTVEAPINIVTIACGKHHSALLGGFVFSIVKSHASVLNRVHLYLVLDVHGQNQIDSCLAIMRRIIQVTVIKLERVRMDELHTFHESRFSCGFYKLNIHNILPQNVTLALFADIDTVINRNTSELLQHHHKLITQGAKSMIWAAMELAESQPCCPQCVKKHNWPAGSCGFNTGFFVVNLQRMRERNTTVAEFFTTNDEPFTVAGDQDILNSHGFYNPKLYGVLPCEWNFRAHAVCKGFDFGNAAVVHGVGGSFLRKLWYVPFEAAQTAIKVCANTSSYVDGYHPTVIVWP